MTIATLIWQPYFSPLPLLAPAMLLTGLAVLAYVRTWSSRPVLSAGLLMMRLVMITTLFLLMLGPSRMAAQMETPDRPRLTFMIDTSASMQHPDMRGQARYDYLIEHWLNDTTLATLEQSYDLELIGFDEHMHRLSAGELHRPATETATGSATHVMANVEQVLADLPPEAEHASLVLFSDGRDSNDASPIPVAQQARSRSIPIHTVPIGGPNLQRDLAVVAMPSQGYLLASEQGQVEIDVYQTNAPHVQTTLRLHGNAELIERTVRFDGRSRLELTLPIVRDEPGLHEFEVEIEPVEGEIELRNNRQRFFVEVTGEPLEVLLLEGEPFWDTKFLAQSLRKDEHIVLTQVIQVSMQRQARIIGGSGGANDIDRRLPQTLDELARYDVIVIGRGLENVLEPEVAELLVEYVAEYGGRVIFARGRAYNPESSAGRAIGRAIAALEPVVWGQGSLRDHQLVLEDSGRVHPSFALMHADQTDNAGTIDELIAQMPHIERLPVVARPKSSARVLARAQPAGVSGAAGQPALLSMPYRRGQVVALLGQGFWRWSLQENQPSEAAGLFDRFWSNTIRWLAMGGDFQPGQEITLRLEQPTVRIGEPITLEVRSRQPIPAHAQPTLHIASPEGPSEQRQLSTGPGQTRQRIEFEPSTTGVYEASVEAGELTPQSVTVRFTVYDVDEERLRSAADPRLMRTLAEVSGGTMLDPQRPERLMEVLSEYRAARDTPPQPEPIWDRASVLVFMLLWMGGEWILRRKGGLL